MHAPRKLPAVVVVLLIAISASVVLARKKPTTAKMPELQRALHALNRLTFGPRPGDVERVEAMGVDRWIEWQLHPDRIDDSALEARLAPLRSLKMGPRTMLEQFPPPQLIKAVAESKLPMPSDARLRAIYEAQLERYRSRLERKQQSSAQVARDGEGLAKADAEEGQDDKVHPEERRSAELHAAGLLQLAPNERFERILRMQPGERQRLVAGLSPQQRWLLLHDLNPEQRETLIAMASPPLVIMSEIASAKLLRAAYSQRQLEEVMTDFWYNHFNVFLGKGADRYLVTAYERDVIRPHALDKFQDLLVATAKSPAMLFYLDNWMSVGPNSDLARYGAQRGGEKGKFRPRARMGVGCGIFGCRPRIGIGTSIPIGGTPQRRGNPQPEQQQAKLKRAGLNENYARELMELHTLGVSGGYTQKDVTEVARVFTGWTLKRPRQGGGFDFNSRMHEPGDKIVLGKKIKEHGEQEGLEVLKMLAHHPSTAHFISSKLAQRFVSDDPPPGLVDRMAHTFLDSSGDIREVLRTMFRSPEFWAPQAYRAKVKTPLEFVASALRASGAEVENPLPVLQVLNRMGMPLYGAQPPAGYSTKAETWVNSSALLNRMNFALALASGRLPGIRVEAQTFLGRPERDNSAADSVPQDPPTALALLETALLAGDVSHQTHDTILKQLNDPQITGRGRPPNLALIAALILGSPEFQRK
ncbi:MAG: DUF1800 domain-containing protein [Terriglobales bacterium]